jgi:hypothetical protein
MIYIIATMKTTPIPHKLESEIARIRKRILGLGPMHPGSVSRQYQVCGRPGCRCMDAKNPRRHGPYRKLAYVHRGKPVCRFVRADCAQEIEARVATYKVFRGLIDRWVELSIEAGKASFFNPPKPSKA